MHWLGLSAEPRALLLRALAVCMTVQAFGLAVLMAKAGVPVPAAAPARLPPFSAVLADIGDEQSLFASLSTFSGHLRRIQVLPGSTCRAPFPDACHCDSRDDSPLCSHTCKETSPWQEYAGSAMQQFQSPGHGIACSGRQDAVQALRREADGRALVLLDEVGTGTDPAEGAALGVALLRALAAGGARGAAFTMATTHHRCHSCRVAFTFARAHSASWGFHPASTF